ARQLALEPSSTIAASPGISSSTCPGRSCPSGPETGSTGHDHQDLVLFMNCLIGLVDGAHGRIDREADHSSLDGAAASNMTRPSFDYAPLCRTTNAISARARQGNYPSHTIALPNVISRPGEFTAPWREAFSAGKAPPSPRGAKVRPGRRRRWLARERRVAARAAGSPP